MEKETNKNAPETFDDMLKDLQSNDYKHIQIFIYKDEPNRDSGIQGKYLVVNNNGFSLSRINRVNLDNGNIQVVITNPENGNPATINLNVQNALPDLFLINWKDFGDMFYPDRTNDDADLLELDTE